MEATVTRSLSLLVLLSSFLAIPSPLRAQATIKGVVTDKAGAILPGVAVEATSDAISGHYGVPWYDSGYAAITLESSGRETVVSEDGDIGPIEFWAIKTAIDDIKKHIQWKPK